MDDLLNVVCVSNEKYLPHLKVLISSLHVTNPMLKVFIVLINVRDNVLRDLVFKHNNITIINRYEKFNLYDEEKAYCANIRVNIIDELLGDGSVSKLCYLDVDSIVRGDLGSAVFGDKDLLILKRNYDRKELRYATGVIYIKNNVATKRFVKLWKSNLEPHLLTWFEDQLTFLKTAEELQERINIGMLSKNYIDWKYRRKTIVWVGKGPRKYENELYKLEEQYYLARGQDQSGIVFKLLSYKVRLKIALTMYLSKLK